MDELFVNVPYIGKLYYYHRYTDGVFSCTTENNQYFLCSKNTEGTENSWLCIPVMLHQVTQLEQGNLKMSDLIKEADTLIWRLEMEGEKFAKAALIRADSFTTHNEKRHEDKITSAITKEPEQKTKKIVYTIGIGTSTVASIIEKLEQYRIRCVIDARSGPDKFDNNDFHPAVLRTELSKKGIMYREYAEFGLHQTDPRYLFPSGYIDFKKYAGSQWFLDGIEKIRKGCDMGYTFAIISKEKNPEESHRGLLIGHVMMQRSYTVRHIIENRIITQEEMEEKLYRSWYAPAMQMSFCSVPDATNKSDQIAKIFRQQNLQIGKEFNCRLTMTSIRNDTKT